MARSGNKDPAALPAAQVVRDYGLRLLSNVDKAVARFRDKNNRRALHDSRVALRRLRSWLQSFDSLLDLKPKHARRLRNIAHSTNGARDAEISLEWLVKLGSGPGRRTASPTDGIARGLAVLRDEQYRQIRRELPAAWRTLSARLRRSLRRRRSPDGDMRFIEAYSGSLRRQTRRLEAALEEARRKPDVRHIHRLRIAVKKVRYLLQAISPWREEFAQLVKRLTIFIDLAGQVQDLQRFLELAEKIHLRQVKTRYRQLLARYVKARDDADFPQFSAPDYRPPPLLTCRAAARHQADCIAELNRSYLKLRYPKELRELQRQIRELRRDARPAMTSRGVIKPPRPPR